MELGVTCALCGTPAISKTQKNKNKFMLVFSRRPSHTFSSLLPCEALPFRSELARLALQKSSLCAKVISVCKMWLRVDAEMCKTSVCQHAHTHTKGKNVYFLTFFYRLIETYTLLNLEQIQTS